MGISQDLEAVEFVSANKETSFNRSNLNYIIATNAIHKTGSRV